MNRFENSMRLSKYFKKQLEQSSHHKEFGQPVSVYTCTGGLQLTRIWLKIFLLHNGAKVICIEWKSYCKFCTLIFSLASDCSAIPSCRRAAAEPGSSRESRGAQPGTRSHRLATSTFTATLFLTSVPCSINYMRYSTLYYKIGFVLDDFAQLQANVNVLSTFKVGWVKLSCFVNQVY